MGEQLPGNGGAQASCPNKKRHPKRDIKTQKTPRDVVEYSEVDADAQGKGDIIT